MRVQYTKKMGTETAPFSRLANLKKEAYYASLMARQKSRTFSAEYLNIGCESFLKALGAE